MQSVPSLPRALFVALLILGLACWLRIIFPLSLPIFGDEGYHIYWAQALARGDSQAYPFLMEGRFLLGVLLASMGINGPAPLRFARLIIPIFSLLGCAAAIAMGRALSPRAHRTPIGLLAGLLYAVLPYTVFHERQVLTDPLMASAGAVGLVATLWVTRTQTLTRTILAIGLAALAFAAAFLFKPLGLIYALASALSVILLKHSAQPQTSFKTLVARNLILWLCVAALSLAFLWALYPWLGVNAQPLFGRTIGFVQCPPLLCKLSASAQWAALQTIAPALPELLLVDFGWPVLLLTCLAWPLSPNNKQPAVRWLLAVVFSILSFFVFAGRAQLVARYLSPLAMPLAALSALGLFSLLQRFRPGPARWVSAIAMVSITAIPLVNTVRLITQPLQARLPAFDRVQYETGFVAGNAFQTIALTIAAQDPAPLILTRHFLRPSLAAFFDPHFGQVLNPAEVTWAAVTDRLAQGRPVYLVDELPATVAPDSVYFYPHWGGTRWVRLQLVQGNTAASTAQLYDFIYSDLTEIQAHYQTLAAALSTEPTPTRLVTYPPHQLAVLTQTLTATHHLQPSAIGGAMPWDPTSVISSLNALPADPPQLAVIFLDETRLDPHRQVEAWLAAHYFQGATQWLGPLRWVTYVSGPDTGSQPWVVNARFAASLDLKAVRLLDVVAAPGSWVRLQLAWQAATLTPPAYKVFVHLVQGETILAQHTSELRPTATWPIGQVVTHQVALRLPPNLPAGTYSFRIGLHAVETPTRVPVLLNDGTAADAWLGGELTVR